jgi:pimeloyl-ACP methyl ester carboxylesterase
MGDPLVLVHGIYAGASGEEYHRNIAVLAGSFTVYTLDLPGFGDSDAPRMTYTAQSYHHLLRDFIHEVIGQPAHVLASGLSCGFAVRLGVYNEEALNRLALIDPVDKPAVDEPGRMQQIQQFVLGTMAVGAGLYETVTMEHELQRFLRSRYHSPSSATPQRLEQLKYNAHRVNSMYPFISMMTGHLETDLFRWLRYVRSPVLLIWGEDRGDPPIQKLLQPAAWSKGKRVERIKDSAHWPHEEQSAQVNRLLIDYFNSTGAVER